MNRRQIPRAAQVMAGLFLLTAGLLPLLALAVVGILDIWYDYRRLTRTAAPEAAQGGGTAARTPQPNAQATTQIRAVHPQ